MRPGAILRSAGAALLLAAIIHVAGPARLLAVLRDIRPGWLAAGLACAIAANLVSALRWHQLAQWFGLAAPLRAMTIAYFRGIAANALLPGATVSGDLLRSLHLTRLGNPLLESSLSVALDRLSGLWVLCLVSLAALLAAVALDILPAPAAAHSAAAAYAAAQLIRPSLLAALLAAGLLAPLLLAFGLRHGLAPLLPARWREGLLRLLGQPAPLRQFGLQLLLSCGVQAFSIAAFACGAVAVGLALPWWMFVVAAAPIFVMAALPVSFGGWGTRELAAAASLGLFGAPRELAVAAAMLYGVFATLQALLGILLPRAAGDKP